MTVEKIEKILSRIVCGSCPGCYPVHKPRCWSMYRREAVAIMTEIELEEEEKELNPKSCDRCRHNGMEVHPCMFCLEGNRFEPKLEGMIV